MNKVAPLICIPLGLYWIFMGITKYKLWISDGPGGGLFPAFCGLLMVICSSIILYRNIKSKDRVPFERKPFILTGAALVSVLLVYILGIFIPVGLFSFCWLKIMEKRSTRQSILVGVGTALVLYVIFQVLLRVPVPRGLIMQLLQRQ